MTTLQFGDTHNLVAFLSKPAESEGFEQIATAKVKTVNGEVQLQALVDGKKIIVTEASVRRDLQLNDEEGTDFLPNATIFEELTRMSVPVENVADKAVYEERDDSLERATTTATGLDAEQDRGNISKTQSKATPNKPSSIGTSLGGGPRLYKVGLSARIDSLDDEANLGDQEDASKQGRKIHNMDADKDITLENVHDADVFGVHDLD
ncbi:hypothetical protein Tco_1416216, partial [Tanacetum coccineum]